jgi:hypothetical protein
VRVEAGVTVSEPLTGTGVTEPVVRSVIEALVPPVLPHESVVLLPSQTDVDEAEKESIVGGWTTVIAKSCVSVAHGPSTVRR